MAEAEAEPEPSLFSADIEVLEEDVYESSSNPPVILIAQSSEDQSLWAVERVRRRLYALCRLKTWVNLQILEQTLHPHWDTSCAQIQSGPQQVQQLADEWWLNTVITPEHEIRKRWDDYTRARKPADFNICLQRTSENIIPLSPGPNQILPTVVTSPMDSLKNMVEEVSQEPKAIFDTIDSQYRESLYASKVDFLTVLPRIK